MESTVSFFQKGKRFQDSSCVHMWEPRLGTKPRVWHSAKVLIHSLEDQALRLQLGVNVKANNITERSYCFA